MAGGGGVIETTTVAADTTSAGTIGPPANGDTLNVTVLGNLVGSIKGGSGADTVTLATSGSISGTIDGGGVPGPPSTNYDVLTLTGSGSATLHGVTNFQGLSVQGGSWSVDDQESFASVGIASGATLNWSNLFFSPTFPNYGTGVIRIDGMLRVEASSTLAAYVTGDGKIAVSPGSFTLTLESTSADQLGAFRNNSSFSGEIDLSGGTLNLTNGAAGAQIVFGGGAETINTTPAGLTSSYTYSALFNSSGPQQPTLVNFAAGDQIVVQGTLSNISISADSISYTYQPATTTTPATGTINFSGLPSGMNLAVVSSSSAQTVFGLVTPPPPLSAQQQFAIEADNLFRVAWDRAN